MWEAKSSMINDNVHKISLFSAAGQLSYEEVIGHWEKNSEFRNFYFSILYGSAFAAFFWENPPVTISSLRHGYEFVLVNSPQLSMVNADPKPFQERFKSSQPGQTVIAFENLGRDAELIVPYPIVPQNIYAHFASFIREAPENQKHDLFMVLANSLKSRMHQKPTWVSTSGLGVYWLHIRLDTRPKYYSYQPYRQFIEQNRW